MQTMSRSTAAGFLIALQSPDVFAAWSAVAKDNYNAVSSFIASTLGLAAAPSPQQLIEIEESMKEMIDEQPGVHAPRAVGFAFVAQSVKKERLRQATLTDAQRRSVAVGFLGALASPDVFNAWANVAKDDQAAISEFVQRALNLAESPSASDLNAIYDLINEIMASQVEATELRIPRHVGFMYAAQNVAEDVRSPRHVGFAFVAQTSEGTISNADLRELLELSRLTTTE